jgi:hypothetical protein
MHEYESFLAEEGGERGINYSCYALPSAALLPAPPPSTSLPSTSLPSTSLRQRFQFPVPSPQSLSPITYHLFPHLIKLRLHRRIAFREFFDGKVFGFIVGYSQVVGRVKQCFFRFLKLID